MMPAVMQAPVAVNRLVPLLWPGTVVCAASGPSLLGEDLKRVCGRAPLIAINAAIQLAPWADIFYSGALEYWTPEAMAARARMGFRGLSMRIAWNEGIGPRQMRRGVGKDGVIVLGNTGEEGLETSPDAVRSYRNSGGAAINVAVHTGATRVVLLGYDMQTDKQGRHHFNGPAREKHHSPYPHFRTHLATMVPHLRALGVEVVNCSRATALTCFPRQRIEDVFP